MIPLRSHKKQRSLDDPAALLFTSLEPPETKPPTPAALPGGELLEPTDLAETFRHSGWAHNRGLVNAALKRTHQTIPRIVAFQSCGAFAYVYQSLHSPYEYRLGGSSCRDRFCVPCALDRSRVLSTNVLNALDSQPARFLTLTLKSNDGPLEAQIDRLYSCFATLRNRSLWTRTVKGGCAFTEVKWSERAHAWNVHIHSIIHGGFLPQRDLSRAWWKITGDSMVLDIRLVRDPAHIGQYVTKYASKPLNNSFVNRSVQFDEVVQAMHGRRLCFTFGTWRGIKLTESPQPGDWINLGSFTEVASRARDGDLEALKALNSVTGNRAAEVILALPLARAPPLRSSPAHPQITFEWLTPDPRF